MTVQYRNNILAYESIVVGSDLRAVQYAYTYNLPLILNTTKNPPLAYEQFERPNTITDSLFKLDLWNKLVFVLTMRGLIPLSKTAFSLRLNLPNKELRVTTVNHKLFIIKFSKCLYLFDDSNIKELPPVRPLENSYNIYEVSDWFRVGSGCKHQLNMLDYTLQDNKKIYFYNDGSKGSKDNRNGVVTVSTLSEAELQQPENLESYIRLYTIDKMLQNGIIGYADRKSTMQLSFIKRYKKHIQKSLEYEESEHFKSRLNYETG